MPTTELPPSREPSQRIQNRKQAVKEKQNCATAAAPSPAPVDLYPGLNDFCDALEAMPMEIIRHFTLLKEIDAKCTVTVPLLSELMTHFLAMPSKEDSEHQKQRQEILAQIRTLIRELMPCLEEKMHVAGVAADAVARHVARIDYDYELITANEIPEEVQIGPTDHPALVAAERALQETRGQASRSESRREAMAARKAAQAAALHQDGVNTPAGTGSGGGGGGNTPTSGSRVGRTATPSTGSRPRTAGSGGTGGQKAGMGSRTNTASVHPLARSVQRSANTGANLAYAHSQTATPTATNNNGSGTRKRKAGATTIAMTGGYAQAGDAEDPYGYDNINNGANDYDDNQESPISRPGTPNARRTKQRTRTALGTATSKDNEPVYCYCQQVSFGEMVGCDGADCKREWFHLPCIGLTSPPKGQWYCQDCAGKYKKKEKR